MINIEIFNVTFLATNCCYLIDSATGCSAVSDPGDKSERLINKIKQNGGKLDYVILTHGHHDHIGYAKQLADMFGAKIVTGAANNKFLSDSNLNLTARHPEFNIPAFSANILLNDGDTFNLGETQIKYISTPGHTSGCGCYIFDDVILSGDTLFRCSYGRTDLPTGDDIQMLASLKKLKSLDGNYNVIPGHGELTTLDYERKFNPVMSGI